MSRRRVKKKPEPGRIRKKPDKDKTQVKSKSPKKKSVKTAKTASSEKKNGISRDSLREKLGKNHGKSDIEENIPMLNSSKSSPKKRTRGSCEKSRASDVKSGCENETSDESKSSRKKQTKNACSKSRSSKCKRDSENNCTEFERKLVPKKQPSKNYGEEEKPEKPNIKELRCEFCDEIFDDSETYKNHMSLHFPFGKRPFRCKACGRTFTEKHLLTQHERKHEIQRPFKCHICDKHFAAKKSLKSHMSNHTGKKHYNCNICDKRFFYPVEVTHHMTSHQTDKKFKCKLCDKQYNLKPGLEHHMMIHEGIKPFRCEVCNNNFISKFELDNHMRYHTGEHPFKCAVCGKAFKRASVLKTHKLGHRKHASSKTDSGSTKQDVFRRAESEIFVKTVPLSKLSPQKETVSLGHTGENGLSGDITHDDSQREITQSEISSKVNISGSENHDSQSGEEIPSLQGEIIGDIPDEDSQREVTQSATSSQMNKVVSVADVVSSREAIPALPGEITLVEASRDEINIIIKTEIVNDYTVVKVPTNSECVSILTNTPSNNLTTNNDLVVVETQGNTASNGFDDDYVDTDIAKLLSSLGKTNTTKKNNSCSKSEKVHDPSTVKITDSAPQDGNSNATIPQKSKSESVGIIKPDIEELLAKVSPKKGVSKVRNNIREHNCPVCDKRFIYPVQLKYHMISHSDDRPYKCPVCGVGFKHKVNLSQHASTHLTEKPFKCKTCGAKFRMKSYLTGHVNAVHLKVRPFKCDICDKTFARRTNLRHHETFVHEKQSQGFKAHVKEVKCTTCGKVVHKKSLAEHMSSHSEVPSYVCGVCGKGFFWRKSYSRHLLTHGSEKPFKCEKCDKSYADKSGLKVHYKSVHCEKTAICQTCGRAFATEQLLQCHQKVHNPEVKLRFPCTLCEKSFHYECGLKSHMISHTGERNHQCPTCGKCFTRDSVLRVHINTHSDTPDTCKDKKEECSLCGKLFSHKNHLKEHIRTHTGERPFSCSVCGKSYATRKAFKYHMANHTGDKPFSCKVCGKAFASNAAAQIHNRVHEEPANSCEICGNRYKSLEALKRHNISAHTENPPRPFVCELCGKSFQTNGGLTKHLLFHTDERKFECDLCGKKYYLNQHLTSHMRSHTGEKPYGCRHCTKDFQTRYGWKKHMMRIHQGYDVNKEGPQMTKNMISGHETVQQSDAEILLSAADIQTSEEIAIETSNITTTEIHPGLDSDTVYIFTY